MVLTDRQRSDLHAGIHEYLLSQPGESFHLAAEALFAADPQSCQRNLSTNNSDEENHRPKTKSSGASAKVPLLEKKWTAVPRLQKKILELERTLSSSSMNPSTMNDPKKNPLAGSSNRRMLPRAPAQHACSGHSAVINTVAIHPLYPIAASGSEDCSVKLWDCESGAFIKSFRGHTQAVNCVAFDVEEKGRWLVSCSSDLSIKIWEVGNGGSGNGGCIRTLRGHDHTISSVVFLPNTNSPSGGDAAGSGSTDNDKGGEADGPTSHLLSASRDHTIKVWDLETGFCIHTMTGHSDWVRCLAVKADGSWIASAGNDTSIIIWNGNQQKKKIGELRGHEHVVESVAFGFEGTATAATNGSKATAPMHDVNKLLVSGSRDRSVRLWNIMSMSCLSVFNVHENWVRSIILHPSGNYILSAGDDRTIRVLDIKSNRCLRTIDNAHDHFVTSISMHPTLPILVSGGVDQLVNCWSLD